MKVTLRRADEMRGRRKGETNRTSQAKRTRTETKS